MSARKNRRISAAHNFYTYNVLSSHLAGANHFRYCDPEDLNADARMDKILSLLKNEVADESIIALQETSVYYANTLHKFFSDNDYYFVNRHYGAAFNDYMGVGIAIPKSKYELLQTDSIRVGDKLIMPRFKKYHWFLQYFISFWKMIVNFFTSILIYFKLMKKPHDHWWHAKQRWNILVSMLLKDKKNGDTFWVSTYHMPCAFRNPDVMLIHSALALQHIQKLANDDTKDMIPYVLMGDFNFKPLDSMYELYMEGEIDEKHPERPKMVPGLKFDLSVIPVFSAYKEFFGEEPEYTNNARVQELPHFIECLDYIFLSRKWQVMDCLEAGGRKEDVDHPFPDKENPSDHVPLKAKLALK